jgi:hypothetical protein
MTFEMKDGKFGIVSITFKIDRMPHPDQRHLTSRLFPMGRVMEYTDDHITILTRKPTELMEEMMNYFEKQHVKMFEYTEVEY